MRRRTVLGPGVVAAVAGLSVITRDTPRGASVILEPGSDWQSVLATAAPGSVVHLAAGVHSTQSLVGVRTDGVHVRPRPGEDVRVEGLQLVDCTGLEFSGFTVESPSSVRRSAVQVTGTSNRVRLTGLTVLAVGEDARSGVEISTSQGAEPPGDVLVRGCLIDGSAATGPESRGVLVRGPEADSSTWPQRIAIVGNEVRRVWADLVQIGGAVDVLVADNLLHSVRNTDDHNDGVQSYASTGLRITGNRFWADGTASGPDQAVIVGGVSGSDFFQVSDTLVENNIVDEWRGQGITVATAAATVVRANTVFRVGGSGLVLSGRNEDLVVANNLLGNVLQVRLEGAPVSLGNVVSVSVADFEEGTDLVPAAGSAAAGTAVRSELPAVDFGGVQRETADVGARTRNGAAHKRPRAGTSRGSTFRNAGWR